MNYLNERLLRMFVEDRFLEDMKKFNIISKDIINSLKNKIIHHEGNRRLVVNNRIIEAYPELL